MQATRLGSETVIVLTDSERLALRGLLGAITGLNDSKSVDYLVEWLQARKNLATKYRDLIATDNLT